MYIYMYRHITTKYKLKTIIDILKDVQKNILLSISELKRIIYMQKRKQMVNKQL